MKEARTIVEERRSAVVTGIRGEAGRDGVFQWVNGPPNAGKPAMLAYNKNSGALRNGQVRTFPSSSRCLAHMVAVGTESLWCVVKTASDVHCEQAVQHGRVHACSSSSGHLAHIVAPSTQPKHCTVRL